MWYDDRSPGQQPPPTDCRTAEAVARRNRDARVIYGDYRDGGEWNDRDRRRAVPRYPGYPSDPRAYPQRYPNEGYYGRDYEYRHPGWERGYGDGVEKGREDAVRNRRYEPNRHSWCRSGTRGYDRRLGSKDEYINVYREAFTAGYAEGFR